MVNKVNFDMVFLMETKANQKRMEGVCRALKFVHIIVVEATGGAGGIILIWFDAVDVKLVWNSKCVI